MHAFRPFTITRLNPGGPCGEDPRPHPRAAHPETTVALVKNLIETTCLTHRSIASRAKIDKGTVSRWRARHGWTRPPGANMPAPRPIRYQPNTIGRVLATRLRIQAERLLEQIEAAETVDPQALAEAICLLAEARAEQTARRAKKLKPPDPAEAMAARTAKYEADKAARAYARWEQGHLTGRRVDTFPSPHIPSDPPWTYTRDRAEAARQGWKRRYERMRGTWAEFKTKRGKEP